MKVLFILGILSSISMHVYTQQYFSKILDFGGDEMEGYLYNVIPLEDEIKVIGLVHDSIVPGFEGGNWPVLSSVSYNGEFLDTHYLIDSTYSDGFYYIKQKIAFKNDSICYLYDRRDTGNPFLDAYLIELNYKNGEILKSKIIYNETIDHYAWFAQNIALGIHGRIYLINIAHDINFEPIQLLTVLDSEFQILSQSIIPGHGRENRVVFTEEDKDGNLIMVGRSHGDETPVWWESQLYRQVLDSNFNSVDFTLAPAEIEHSIAAATYPVIKSHSGTWIAATQEVVETPDCEGCAIWVPHVVCVSGDFSEVLWETQMFDGNITSSIPAYFVESVTEVSDGYIFAAYSDLVTGIKTSGILGKVGFNGDSLWFKRYIPIGWDTTQGWWFQWQDIKTTPKGDIVVGGHCTYGEGIVPWLLHLDKDGCLEPGCQTTSTTDPSSYPSPNFTVYPNPASEQCTIHFRSRSTSSVEYTLRIVNDQGMEVYQSKVPGRDVQYMVNLRDWSTGVYIVQLTDDSGDSQSKQLVVVK